MADTSEKRRIARTLTQKYDMHALRALQKLEQDFLQKLAPIYNCDEDEVPIELDLLTIYNSPEEERLPAMQELLKAAPADVNELVVKLLADLDKIENLPASNH